MEKYLLLNIRGMSPSINSKSFWKIQYLNEQYLQESTEKIPIIIILETWLKSYISDAQIAIPHYQIVRSDRKHRERGGALIYLHEDLPLTDENSYDNGTCEVAVCNVPTSNTIIVSVYRPPDTSGELFADSLKFLQKYLDNHITNEQSNILMFGDFNLPNINWNDLSVSKNYDRATADSAKLLLTFMEKNLLSQYVDVQTREKNILDLMLTNNSNLISHCESEKTELSDHDLVSIYTRYPLHTEQQEMKRKPFEPHSFRSLNLKKADFSKIKSHLLQVPWGFLYEECSPEEFPELLKLIVLQICELFAPPKKIFQATNKCPQKRKILKRKRRRLQKAINSNKNSFRDNSNSQSSLNKKLNEIHIQIHDSIKQQRITEEKSAIDTIKENPRFFYSYAKRHSRQSTNIGPLLDSDNKLQSDPQVMADLLQNQYVSVFSDPNSPMIQNTLEEEIDWEPITDFEFSEKEIIKAIAEINTYSACGENEIPALVLKSCKEELSYPIWRMWRESLDTGFISSIYKKQTITPIHKKNSRAQAANYRPVSLTSHVIKTFERVFKKKLVLFLEKFKIIKLTQHAFCEGRSCLTQLISHIEEIIQNLLRNNDTDAVYLDYAKAFDKVDHKLLLQKIYSYGIRGKLHAWLTFYLEERVQYVVVNGSKSYPAPVQSGVPQGTVLGPLLFILYLNDLNCFINKSTMRSFADDTRLLKEIKNTEDITQLQNDLNASILWSKRNNMLLHTDKFEYVCHRSGNSKFLEQLPFTKEFFQYDTGSDNQLYPIHQVKDLGVVITEDLSWSPHINTMCDTARRKLSWILSVFNDRSKRIMLTLFKSLVRSILEYCCPLWDPTKIDDIIKIESVQRLFTSKISSVSHQDYCNRLKSLRLMSLQRRRERYSIIHIFKILNNQTPNEINLQFHTTERRGTRIKIPTVPKDAKQRHVTHYYTSFAIRASRLWNSIPAELTKLSTLAKFKIELGKYLDTLPDNPPTQEVHSRNSLLDFNIKDRTGGCFETSE